MAQEPTPVPRTSARVILIDDRERVLLFSGRVSAIAHAGDRRWFLPGGGAEAGETLAETAARELFEETGLCAEPGALRGPVAVSRGIWSDGVTAYRAADYLFALPIGRWEPLTGGFTPLERDQISGHRWWSLGELQATTEIVFPLGFAAVFARLLAGDWPAQPIELIW